MRSSLEEGLRVCTCLVILFAGCAESVTPSGDLGPGLRDQRPTFPDTGNPVQDFATWDLPRTDLPVPDAGPNCADNIKNGAETDVDCGGLLCSGCGAGQSCLVATDCQSGVCDPSTNRCATSSCTDGAKGGAETDVDCGGTQCPQCADGKACQGNTDCESGVCGTDKVCAAPTCDDTVKNGAETDVDCGGSTCAKCTDGKACNSGTDCAGGVCDASNHCASPQCTDTVKNGAETDVDCGGTQCPPCAIGKACLSHTDCQPNKCDATNKCAALSSCLDVLTVNPSAASGTYSIQPASASGPLTVYCDMTTDGGGWTQLLQCLPSDSCADNLYNVDWLANDSGTHADDKSYLLGKSLSALVSTGHFMTKVTDTAANKTGAVVFPLSAETKKFFSTTALYRSEALSSTIIDSDGATDGRSLRVCWMTTAASPYARSYRGVAGLRFLGKTSAGPNADANTQCSYGSWASQILLRHPDVDSITAVWGISPSSDWGSQAYAHRILVRETTTKEITIVNQGSGRRWSDGTYARSCNDYRRPGGSIRAYKGSTGDGVYTIKPTENANPVDVYCEMTTDGGGWTLISVVRNDGGAAQVIVGNNYCTSIDATTQCKGKMPAAFVQPNVRILVKTVSGTNWMIYSGWSASATSGLRFFSLERKLTSSDCCGLTWPDEALRCKAGEEHTCGDSTADPNLKIEKTSGFDANYNNPLIQWWRVGGWWVGAQPYAGTGANPSGRMHASSYGGTHDIRGRSDPNSGTTLISNEHQLIFFRH